jgi:hypothetical protein
MPQVPVIANEHVDLASQPGFGATLPSAGAFTAGADQLAAAGRGMEKLADGLDQYETQKAHTEVFDAEAKAKQAWIEQAAVLQKTRQGTGAQGVTDDVNKWWGENAPKFLEGASSPRAQRMLKQSLTRLQLQGVSEFKSFELRQGEVAADAALEANVKASITSMAANPSPDNMALHRTGIAAALKAQAAAKGWAPEVLNDKLATAESAGTIAAFNTIMARNPAEARDFWALNRETVRGEMRDEIETRLKSGLAYMDGEKAVDQVWATMGPKKDIDPVETDKLATALRKQFEGQPETMKAALSALKERAAEHNAAQAERTAAGTNDAMAVWLSTKNLGRVMASDAYAKLPPQQQAHIIDYINTSTTTAINREYAAAGRDVMVAQRDQTRLQLKGYGTYLDVSDPYKLGTMSRAQVQAMLPQLGNELTGHLLQRYDAMQTADGKRTAKMDEDNFKSVAREFKLPVDTDHSKLSEDQRAMLGNLKSRVEILISQAEAQAKKPMTVTEKVDLMRGELAKQVLVKNPWYWPDAKTSPITLTPEQIKNVAVPAEHRTAILRAWPKGAGAPSEDAIRRMYLLKQSRITTQIPDAAN